MYLCCRAFGSANHGFDTGVGEMMGARQPWWHGRSELAELGIPPSPLGAMSIDSLTATVCCMKDVQTC